MRCPSRPADRLTIGLVTFVLVTAAAVAHAQTRRFTIDDLFDETRRQELTGATPVNVTWLDDRTYIWPKRLEKQQGVEWLKVDAERGTSTAFYDASRLEKALQDIGVSATDATRMARPRSFTFDPTRTLALITVLGDLYACEFSSGRLTRLTTGPGEEIDGTFSPDGRTVAFTRNNNLFVVDVATQRERALTTDGTGQILNGRLDWVYQEEIYGRGTYRGFWWSPDSTRLAFIPNCLRSTRNTRDIDIRIIRPIAIDIFIRSAILSWPFVPVFFILCSDLSFCAFTISDLSIHAASSPIRSNSIDSSICIIWVLSNTLGDDSSAF
jgi:hypothetical protein